MSNSERLDISCSIAAMIKDLESARDIISEVVDNGERMGVQTAVSYVNGVYGLVNGILDDLREVEAQADAHEATWERKPQAKKPAKPENRPDLAILDDLVMRCSYYTLAMEDIANRDDDLIPFMVKEMAKTQIDLFCDIAERTDRTRAIRS